MDAEGVVHQLRVLACGLAVGAACMLLVLAVSGSL